MIASLKEISGEYLDRLFGHIMSTRKLSEEAIGDFKAMVTKTTLLKSPEEQAIWANRQAYVALGAALSTAALLGIDSCPMEGINSANYDELLGLDKTDYTSRVALALGYRSDEDPNQHLAKVRFSGDEIFDSQ